MTKIEKIDVDQLVEDMTDAAKKVLKYKKWSTELRAAKAKFRELGECIKMIERNKTDGLIQEEDARDLIAMQKNAIQSVLLQIKGMQTVMAEMALNAAIDVVRDTVNKAIGWELI